MNTALPELLKAYQLAFGTYPTSFGKDTDELLLAMENALSTGEPIEEEVEELQKF